MSGIITQYDRLLVNRVEAYRKVRGLTQAKMAEASGESVDKYKRTIYFEQKPYAEPLAIMSVNLGVSLDEIMLGKNDEYLKMINYIRTCPMKQLGEIFRAISDRCMVIPTPQSKKGRCDYMTEDGALIETIMNSVYEEK